MKKSLLKSAQNSQVSRRRLNFAGKKCNLLDTGVLRLPTFARNQTGDRLVPTQGGTPQPTPVSAVAFFFLFFFCFVCDSTEVNLRQNR